MRGTHWLVLAALLAGCGESASSKGPVDVAGNDQSGNTDIAAPSDETSGELAGDRAAPDVDTGDPVPAYPIPEMEPGTYAYTGDNGNGLTMAFNGNRVFVLASSFGCEGTSGCKVRNEFSRITCKSAFEKGYSAAIVDGVFVIEGIRSTDRLAGALTGANRISLRYELSPGVPCCSSRFIFDVEWTQGEDCLDFETPDCDLYTDAHCDDGFNCILGVHETPTCVLAGTVEVGQPCATQGSCSDGVCMALAADTKNHCYQYCKLDSDCAAGARCLGMTGKAWKVCSLPEGQYTLCNLLEQDCEKSTQACFLHSSPIGKPICLAAGSGEVGDPCSTSSECKKGFDCIQGSLCRRLCRPQGGEPACASAFDSCIPIPGWTSAGYCSASQ
jgi:hypothetical protein